MNERDEHQTTLAYDTLFTDQIVNQRKDKPEEKRFVSKVKLNQANI